MHFAGIFYNSLIYVLTTTLPACKAVIYTFLQAMDQISQNTFMLPSPRATSRQHRAWSELPLSHTPASTVTR